MKKLQKGLFSKTAIQVRMKLLHKNYNFRQSFQIHL